MYTVVLQHDFYTIIVTLVQFCAIVGLHSGKNKAIPLKAWTGPEGFRRLRLPDFKTLSREDGKVSPTHRPSLPPSPRKYSWYSFLLENDTIENGTRDLRVCSAVPQPTTPPRVPKAVVSIAIVANSVISRFFFLEFCSCFLIISLHKVER